MNRELRALLDLKQLLKLLLTLQVMDDPTFINVMLTLKVLIHREMEHAYGHVTERKIV